MGRTGVQPSDLTSFTNDISTRQTWRHAFQTTETTRVTILRSDSRASNALNKVRSRKVQECLIIDWGRPRSRGSHTAVTLSMTDLGRQGVIDPKEKPEYRKRTTFSETHLLRRIVTIRSVNLDLGQREHDGIKVFFSYSVSRFYCVMSMSNDNELSISCFPEEDASPPPPPSPSVAATPLPKLQILFALLIQGVEPITAGVIYPFIPELIERTGVTGGDESKIGYYAGIIESLFFLSESLVVAIWGRASDLYGRKPVLLLGPLGLAFAMLGFGLSKTFWPLVVFRCAQGMFNGNIGVSKTVLAELTDETNRADAFALISVAWTSGATLGPAIGGMFANPATRWPDMFGNLWPFVDYPYFLPLAVAGLLSLVTFVLALLGLKETHPHFKTKRERGQKSGENSALLAESNTENGYGTVSTESVTTQPEDGLPQRPSYRSLLTPELKMVFTCRGFLALTDISYVVLIPLIYSASTKLGGLGFTPSRIGTILGVYMFFNALNSITLSKRLVKKFGARTMFIVGYGSFLADFLGLMILRMLVKRAGGVTTAVWVVLVVQQMMALMVSTAYTSLAIVTVQSAPEATLGTVNGLSQMIASGTRAVGPAFASSLFALSLQSKLLDGYFVDVVLMGVTLLGLWFAFRLPHVQ
ncbi:hypothetical protein E1B28_007975 [Marasmius oreades]|uniref:Major facilitator superfamily (MFS) profile domain-containing protein n=1 Tax=Marasmius oreades TaxID=181124 RepID=A0A9P7S2N4_9AGAR|nr:uncharacterized protein E1B28_007975 [Marasmius oreades]KAG7094374.1 hypothetical protein E1B28_007975 [Marasmius oreades]